jgi:hypothetical protein
MHLLDNLVSKGAQCCRNFRDAFAVLRLKANSNWVGIITGTSAGFSRQDRTSTTPHGQPRAHPNFASGGGG